jgi:nucleotide-binding universal stress UspA family protein
MDVPADPDPTAGRRPRVVVGIDGSSGSRAALRHALGEAARRGADLDLLSAYQVGMPWPGVEPFLVPEPAQLRADVESCTRALVDDVLREATGLTGVDAVNVRILPVPGPAAQALVDASRDAALLVVGSRGRGPLRSAVLGSVALHCIAGARCPVVVVHASTRPVPAGPVVVGIDGSDASRAALRAGMDEAARLGTRVEAVAAFSSGSSWYGESTGVLTTADEIAEDVRARAVALVREVLGRAAGTAGVRVTVRAGRPTDVLVAAARDAAVLVVGSRGRGAFRGLLLGSVAMGCALAADCPVMVVHPLPARADLAAEAAAVLSSTIPPGDERSAHR